MSKLVLTLGDKITSHTTVVFPEGVTKQSLHTLFEVGGEASKHINGYRAVGSALKVIPKFSEKLAKSVIGGSP